MGLLNALEAPCPSTGHLFVCEGHLLSLRTVGVLSNNGIHSYPELHELVPGDKPGIWVWRGIAVH